MTIPTMTPVEGSSQIKAVGQDGDHLFIEFHGFAGKPSSVYRYWRKGDDGDHPTTHHDTLLNVAKVEGFSAGKHFNQNLRHAFAYEKVSA
jgi:hypothetical protein